MPIEMQSGLQSRRRVISSYVHLRSIMHNILVLDDVSIPPTPLRGTWPFCNNCQCYVVNDCGSIIMLQVIGSAAEN